MGRNGQGKSNIHLAIQYLLTDLKILKTREGRRSYLHEKVENGDIIVEVQIDNSDGSIPVKSQKGTSISLKKISHDDLRISYYINDKQVKEDYYYDILRCGSLHKEDSINIILQGNVNKVSQFSEKELFDSLKNSIGTKSYEQKVSESNEILDSIPGESSKVHNLIEEYEKKVEDLNQDKGDYEEFLQTEKVISTQKHIIYRRNKETIEAKNKEDNERLVKLRDECINRASDEMSLKSEITKCIAKLKECRQK